MIQKNIYLFVFLRRVSQWHKPLIHPLARRDFLMSMTQSFRGFFSRRGGAKSFLSVRDVPS